MPEGYITKGIGGFYYVKAGDRMLECKAKGIFSKRNITPVAGDKVVVEEEAGSWVIAEILPRKNVFVRPPIANLDVLFIVASTTQPTPSTLVLDKLSAIAADKGVQPVLIITKSDLAGAEKLKNAYALSPLPVIVADHVSGEGLDDIRGWIEGRLCAFCGNSGVGKSTLLNALLPDLSRETGSISQKLGRGRHTTREVEIFEAFGGLVADTALPAWTPAAPATSPRRTCSTPSRSSRTTSPGAASPAAPIAARRAAPCAKRWRRAR